MKISAHTYNCAPGYKILIRSTVMVGLIFKLAHVKTVMLWKKHEMIQNCQSIFIHLVRLLFMEYRKHRKIRWVKLSQDLLFLRVPREFYCEYLSNKHLWSKHCKNTSTKYFTGLKLTNLSMLNLSKFMALIIASR